MSEIPFTFGIITNGSDRVASMIAAIEAENIPEFEIVIVGQCDFAQGRSRCTVIPFDENVKPKWITRKKNLITKNAKYENVVYMHDYIYLEKGWYEGWKKFGDKYDLCMNPIIQPDGSRYREWMLCPCLVNEEARAAAGFSYGHAESLLPYEETSLTKAMYFSGSYWVAKKAIMEEFPLDERLTWGQGEDIFWSHQVRSKYTFSINTFSRVRIPNPRDPFFYPIRPEVLERFKAYIKDHPLADGAGCFAPNWPLENQP